MSLSQESLKKVKARAERLEMTPKELIFMLFDGISADAPTVYAFPALERSILITEDILHRLDVTTAELRDRIDHSQNVASTLVAIDRLAAEVKHLRGTLDGGV